MSFDCMINIRLATTVDFLVFMCTMLGLTTIGYWEPSNIRELVTSKLLIVSPGALAPVLISRADIKLSPAKSCTLDDVIVVEGWQMGVQVPDDLGWRAFTAISWGSGTTGLKKKKLRDSYLTVLR